MKVLELSAPRGRVAVLGDTHSQGPLPLWLMDGLREADLILHTGDLTSAAVLRRLESLGVPVVAVQGNNDPPGSLPLEVTLIVRETRILLFHGHTGGRSGSARERARDIFGYDVILYGHSHRPEAVEEGRTLIVNPGSPTQPRLSRRPSAAWLLLGEGRREAELWGP